MLVQQRREDVAAKMILRIKADVIRWDVYRAKRLVAVNNFVQLVKANRRSLEYLVNIKVRPFVAHIAAIFRVAQLKAQRQRNAYFIAREVWHHFQSM